MGKDWVVCGGCKDCFNRFDSNYGYCNNCGISHCKNCYYGNHDWIEIIDERKTYCQEIQFCSSICKKIFDASEQKDDQEIINLNIEKLRLQIENSISDFEKAFHEIKQNSINFKNFLLPVLEKYVN
ncbi:MAG TPA: hypothetical protein V6C58_23215 [Allocoleopsis sp.]